MATVMGIAKEMTPEKCEELRKLARKALAAPSPLWRYFEGQQNGARPRVSAGVATMAELMRRSRVERDFGGVEDE